MPPVSILSVVVNELDGGVKAHHGDECMQGKHLPPSNPYGTCGHTLVTPDNVTGLNCTTFLKAHPNKYQTGNTLTLSAVATVLCALQKRKPSIELGFVKMGDKRLR
ncbi:TPA: hypothetical protein ONC52_001978 [Enterobacter asburiae]|nr:hypothetical protein [Enterobacter asburiae]HCR2223679.1 hypothetical protein [Enterobacter asburiae]